MAGTFQDYHLFVHAQKIILSSIQCHANLGDLLVFLRHNEVRDLTAKLLTEVCKDVSREPKLVNKTNDDDEDLRADISARGVWATIAEGIF